MFSDSNFVLSENWHTHKMPGCLYKLFYNNNKVKQLSNPRS